MLYHITPLQNVPSIMREGLAPRIGKASLQAGEKEPCVYLFTSKKVVLEAVETWYYSLWRRGSGKADYTACHDSCNGKRCPFSGFVLVFWLKKLP